MIFRGFHGTFEMHHALLVYKFDWQGHGDGTSSWSLTNAKSLLVEK